MVPLLPRHLARLRRAPLAEWPFRAEQLWTRATDRWWRPRPTPDGPPVAWPGEDRGLPRSIPAPPRDALAAWPDGAAMWLDLLGERDPHPAWEESRLQHLAASAWAGDAAAAQHAEAFVRRWPAGHGIPWATAMEAALRLVSLVRISTRFPSRRLRYAVHAHAQWLLRHPSRGSSANNHRVAELGALALAAAVLPDVPEARELARAAAELPAILRAQLHPDGSGVEQSPHYLAYDLEWALLARRCGVADLDEPLVRGAGFLGALLDRTGAAPALGDADDGRVIADWDEPYLGSVVRAIRGTGTDARAAAIGADLGPVDAGASVTFPEGGLTVLSAPPYRAIVDHGPLGEAHLGAHGHANALALYVHGPRGPIIVGRGTGTYVGDPRARRFHRGTGAHPTVVIDGQDQSEPHDHPFLWRSRATCRAERIDLRRRWVMAHHDGYLRRNVHHRRIVAVDDRRIVVTDELDGRGPHHVSVRWPIAPGLEVDAALQIWDDHGRIARIVPDGELDVDIVTGGSRPGPGWHAPRYGEWVEASTVLAERVVPLPARFVTVIELG